MITLAKAKQTNLHLLKHHAQTNTGRTQSYPRLLALTVLERCNLHCKMCYQNHKSKDELPLGVINKIEPILPFVDLVNITGGEPLLYSHIDHFFDLCKRNNCSPCIQTNGMLLSKERAAYIISRRINVLKISCDGATRQTFEGIRRGGNFQKLVNNIITLQLLKEKKRISYPRLEFNFVSMASNIRELPQLVMLADKLGIEVINVFPLRVARPDLVHESLFFYQSAANAAFTEAETLGNKLGVKVCLPPLFKKTGNKSVPPTFGHCIAPWEGLTIDITGKAAICCGGAGEAGDLTRENFNEVWNHPKRVRTRETVNTAGQLPACNRCRLGNASPDNIHSHIPDKDMAANALALFGNNLEHSPDEIEDLASRLETFDKEPHAPPPAASCRRIHSDQAADPLV